MGWMLDIPSARGVGSVFPLYPSTVPGWTGHPLILWPLPSHCKAFPGGNCSHFILCPFLAMWFSGNLGLQSGKSLQGQPRVQHPCPCPNFSSQSLACQDTENAAQSHPHSTEPWDQEIGITEGRKQLWDHGVHPVTHPHFVPSPEL